MQLQSGQCGINTTSLQTTQGLDPQMDRPPPEGVSFTSNVPLARVVIIVSFGAVFGTCEWVCAGAEMQ